MFVKKLSIGFVLLSFVTSICLAEAPMARLGENLPNKKEKKSNERSGSSVNMKNVKIYNKTNVTNSSIAGNVGIAIKGRNVKISNSKFVNKSNVRNSSVAGNTGISIKAKKINMQNVNIQSESNINNSSISGNTGVSVGN